VDGVHDMGGMQGFGPVVTPDGGLSHHEAWEVRAQVLAVLSRSATRNGIEHLDPATYLASSYYERWLRTAETTLVRRGHVTQAELNRWISTFAADPDARPPVRNDPLMAELIRGLGPHHHRVANRTRYQVGAPVRVRRTRPEGHHRCPRYVRGAVGEIEKVIGADPVPGVAGPHAVREPCYTVRFDSVELFGDRTADGEPPYVLLIDLWERYLEAP
jgi:nitrile hydratase